MRTVVGSLIVTLLAFVVLRGLWPALRQRRGALAWWAAAAVIYLAFLGARHPGSGILGPITRGALTVWFVACLVVLFAGVPARLVLWARQRFLSRRPSVPDASPNASPVAMPHPAIVDERRRQLLGLALPAAAVSVSAAGTFSALSGFVVRHERLRIPGLPAALEGFRIGQLTDVHVGEFIDTEHLTRAVAALDEQGVDLQVMTGDLIDDLSQLEPTMDALEGCRAPHGMLAILGNHEKWRGERAVLEAYARRAPNGRLRLLVDENVLIQHKDAALRVTGVDYPMRKGRGRRLPRAERRAVMHASAEAAWRGVGADETVLCLTHHPDFFPIAAERGAHLTLAGHTHGGQVGFFRVPLFFFAFEHMLGRYTRGRAQLYVSGGTGHWLPFRVGIPAEVTVLTLTAAA